MRRASRTATSRPAASTAGPPTRTGWSSTTRRAYYSGWQGKYWAWSGGKGEAAIGKLTSKPFMLDKDGVRMLISGWTSIRGTGSPRKWNYVTLNLADGTEIDRVYAPDTTGFVSAFLDGSKHKGKMVYIEAVDDADQPTFSMLCIDDVRTADLPKDYTKPAPALPRVRSEEVRRSSRTRAAWSRSAARTARSPESTTRRPASN